MVSRSLAGAQDPGWWLLCRSWTGAKGKQGELPRPHRIPPSPLRWRLPSPICFAPRGQCQVWAVWAAAGAQGSL